MSLEIDANFFTFLMSKEVAYTKLTRMSNCLGTQKIKDFLSPLLIPSSCTSGKATQQMRELGKKREREKKK